MIIPKGKIWYENHRRVGKTDALRRQLLEEFGPKEYARVAKVLRDPDLDKELEPISRLSEQLARLSSWRGVLEVWLEDRAQEFWRFYRRWML